MRVLIYLLSIFLIMQPSNMFASNEKFERNIDYSNIDLIGIIKSKGKAEYKVRTVQPLSVNEENGDTIFIQGMVGNFEQFGKYRIGTNLGVGLRNFNDECPTKSCSSHTCIVVSTQELTEIEQNFWRGVYESCDTARDLASCVTTSLSSIQLIWTIAKYDLSYVTLIHLISIRQHLLSTFSFTMLHGIRIAHHGEQGPIEK